MDGSKKDQPALFDTSRFDAIKEVDFEDTSIHVQRTDIHPGNSSESSIP
jgi:hypothetical protein